MAKKCVGAITLVALLATASAAQDAREAREAREATSVISNIPKGMGVDGLNSVTFYGAGATFNLGQNNNSNAPWPRTFGAQSGRCSAQRPWQQASCRDGHAIAAGPPHVEAVRHDNDRSV